MTEDRPIYPARADGAGPPAHVPDPGAMSYLDRFDAAYWQARAAAAEAEVTDLKAGALWYLARRDDCFAENARLQAEVQEVQAANARLQAENTRLRRQIGTAAAQAAKRAMRKEIR